MAYLTLFYNTKSDAITQYKNFMFDSYANFRGKMLCGNSDGIFSHEGDNDNGTSISAYVLTPNTDLYTANQKRIRKAYIGYQTDGSIRFSIYDDENNIRVYDLDVIRAREKQGGQVLPVDRNGKGRYWQFKIENINGADFSIDDLRALFVLLNRKPSGSKLI